MIRLDAKISEVSATTMIHQQMQQSQTQSQPPQSASTTGVTTSQVVEGGILAVAATSLTISAVEEITSIVTSIAGGVLGLVSVLLGVGIIQMVICVTVLGFIYVMAYYYYY